MERIGNKVSYIKKPFAKNSFVAAGLAAAALVFYAAAISFSYYTQGNAPLAAAALGFCSIIIAVSSVVYGVFAMMEKEKNYLLAKISLAAAGILLLVWVLCLRCKDDRAEPGTAVRSASFSGAENEREMEA